MEHRDMLTRTIILLEDRLKAADFTLVAKGQIDRTLQNTIHRVIDLTQTALVVGSLGPTVQMLQTLNRLWHVLNLYFPVSTVASDAKLLVQEIHKQGLSR